MDTQRIYIECDCHSEGLVAEVFNWEEDFPDESGGRLPIELWISFFSKSQMGKGKLRFKDKLKWLWHIFTKGYAYTDMIILDKENAEALVHFIQDKFISDSRSEAVIKENNPTV
jgi:hypothetical protein